MNLYCVLDHFMESRTMKLKIISVRYIRYNGNSTAYTVVYSSVVDDMGD